MQWRREGAAAMGEAVAVEDTTAIEESNWWGQFGGANLEGAVWWD